MKLLTKEIRKMLPKLGEQSSIGTNDTVAYVKFFTPWSNWTWYAMEFDGEDTFFGYVSGIECEFGTFSLRELKSIQGTFGLKIERDKFFKPTKISELIEKHEGQGR